MTINLATLTRHVQSTTVGVSSVVYLLVRELGARPSNQECYIDGKAVYEKIANKPVQLSLFAQYSSRISYRRVLFFVTSTQIPTVCHKTYKFPVFIARSGGKFTSFAKPSILSNSIAHQVISISHQYQPHLAT